MNIQPIVEGHGEVQAVPILLRRLLAEAGVYDVDVNSPIRKPGSTFFREGDLRAAVRLALKSRYCGAILILFDGDHEDDCPKTHCPEVSGWAQAEAGSLACEVVMAYREYEAWFLATIESLRGRRGIRQDAVSHPEPELPTAAKAHLEQRMESGHSYAERADQPALTQLFDLATAYRRCRSFRRLVRAFGMLTEAAGGTMPAEWPPADWTTP
jgi:hypothetical protein